MTDWGSSDSDIQVESVEEIVDTNPDLYKQRTIAALNEKRYSDAIKEAETAIEYGNNVLEYQVLLLRTLFEKGDYQDCFQYIKGSGLWDNREDDTLLYDEQDYIISCYYACSLVLTDTEMLAGLTWETYHENKKLILLLEILMENHWKEQYEIKSEMEFSKAVKLVRLIKKIRCGGKNPKGTNFHDEIQKCILGIEQEINQTKVKRNMEAAVKEMMDKFTATCASVKETAKVRGGETKEEYVNRMEGSIDVMQGMLGGALQKLVDITGYTDIKNSVYGIMEKGLNEKTNKKDLFKMAQKCRERIDEEIEFLMELGEEEDFRKAIALKAINGEGEEFTKSIFESFVGGCTWIGKKVSRKLRQWCKLDDEKSVFGAICRKLSSAAGVLRAGARIVFNPVVHAISSVIENAINKATEAIRPNTISAIFARQNNWKIICNERFRKRNVFADELECQYLLKELEGGLGID